MFWRWLAGAFVTLRLAMEVCKFQVHWARRKHGRGWEARGGVGWGGASTRAKAAESGHPDTLIWAHESGCAWDADDTHDVTWLRKAGSCKHQNGRASMIVSGMRERAAAPRAMVTLT